MADALPFIATTQSDAELVDAYLHQRLTAEGSAVAQQVVEKLDPKRAYDGTTIDQVSRQVSHDELVQYLALRLCDEPGARWKFWAKTSADTIAVDVERLLFLPSRDSDVNLDELAHVIQEGSETEKEAAIATFLTMSEAIPRPDNAALEMWHGSAKHITAQLAPIVDQLRADGTALIARWRENPPCPGFDREDFWGRNNLLVIGENASTIAERDVQLYLAEGLLHRCPDGWWMFDTIVWPGTSRPNVHMFIYYPPLKNVVNIEAEADLLKNPGAVEHLWTLLHQPEKLVP